MDKYTVDLDKVLNDFEYNELTEQSNGYSTNNPKTQQVYNYTSSNSVQNQYGYPSNPRTSYTYDGILSTEQHTYPKLPMPTTKHSINTVFHSLNEYLNSDIKTTASSSFADTNTETEPCAPIVRKSSNDTTIKDIFKKLTKDSSTEIFKKDFSSEVTKENEPETLNSDIEEEETETVLTENDNKEVVIESHQEYHVNENETESPLITEQNAVESILINLEEPIINNVTVDTIEDEIENMPVKVVGFEEIIDLSDSEMNKELELLEAEYAEHFNNDEQEELVEKDLKSELEEANLTSNKIYDFNTPESNVQLEENLTPCNESTMINLQDIELCENHKKQSEGDIGIEQDLVSIEDDLRCTVPDITAVFERANYNNKEIELSLENIPPKEDNKTINESEQSEDKKDVEYECETIDKSVEICEEARETANNSHSTNITAICINNEIVDQENIISESTLENKNSEVTDPENTVGEKDDSECSDTKVERRNSGLMRPNSLDLNSDTGSDNVTIDLIGDPGSTPYNNVYIQNKLQTDKKTQKSELLEPEVEPTNSLSPTLSDASTIDNSDSPNTSDSCNDTSLDEYTDENPVKTAEDLNKRKEETNNETQNKDSARNEENSTAKEENSTGTDTAQPSTLQLGQTAPFWIPDSDTQACQHCQQKFKVLRRRHHCRACGLVLCAACCHDKYPIPYLGGTDARVCVRCLRVLQQLAADAGTQPEAPQPPQDGGGSSGSANSSPDSGALAVAPPAPAGVLKRTGSAKSRHSKSVTFCDGVRPGHDISEITITSASSAASATVTTAGSTAPTIKHIAGRSITRSLPDTHTYIPAAPGELPPIVGASQPHSGLEDRANNNGSSSHVETSESVMAMMREDEVKFALRRNLFVRTRIINMECCINKTAWCFTTEGMITVGQDEIIILLEFIDNEREVPKDIFYHLDNIYNDALKGTSITEMELSIHTTSNFLGSKNHVGFLFIKPSFQCIQNVIIPKEPYLIGLLIHRWETPWAKIFPLRLLLRLGAEYRYYPSPIISTRHRESVYVEIGHTIINLLADFRNFSYTIPAVRGLTIHMKGQNTTVSIPINRYDQVMKALNNSSDHILAFAANFSPKADSHLVCIQDTHGNNENSYTTHAINIHNRPREVTGASFIVLNGALKSTSGLTAKSSIIEDGLMIQILPDQMVKLRNSLRNMKDFKINCGCLNAQSDESVNILWTENDVNFNVGVISPIDGITFNGVPSIRVHNGKDYVCNSGNKLIRWTEVFIIQSGEECSKSQDPIDVSKLSENIAKATAQALVKYLDLLAANNFMKIGIRTTLHVDNVSYLAGSNGTRLPPIYMKSLDNELVPVLHRIITNGSNSISESAVILELVFHILNA